MAFWEITAARLVDYEGVYVKDPKDPGGETKYGITKRDYPRLDIANLSLSDAQLILRVDFWDPLKLYELNDQTLATLVFYGSICTGVHGATRCLQQAVNFVGAPYIKVRVDGDLGPKTRQAANSVPTEWLNDSFRLYLIKRFDKLVEKKPVLKKYFRGWVRRALK
jgi:lysozyme family protein